MFSMMLWHPHFLLGTLTMPPPNEILTLRFGDLKTATYVV